MTACSIVGQPSVHGSGAWARQAPLAAAYAWRPRCTMPGYSGRSGPDPSPSGSGAPSPSGSVGPPRGGGRGQPCAEQPGAAPLRRGRIGLALGHDHSIDVPGLPCGETALPDLAGDLVRVSLERIAVTAAGAEAELQRGLLADDDTARLAGDRRIPGLGVVQDELRRGARLPARGPAERELLAYRDERAHQLVRAVRAELHVASRAAPVPAGPERARPDLLVVGEDRIPPLEHLHVDGLDDRLARDHEREHVGPVALVSRRAARQ